MDANFILKKAKNQKFRKKQNDNRSRMGIDNLPDAILEHILSYLSTEDAIRTSILSKRWQYLWTSIPKLHLDEGEPEERMLKPDERMLFMDFVERALALRDSSNIKEFSLSCDVQCDTSRINAWIIAVVKHKVQVLDLYLRNFQEPFALPPSLFTCESLKVLTLKMFHHLKLPSNISFSHLKILTLEKAIFSDDNSTQRLFLGCPLLEELNIIDCIWKNVKAVLIFFPMLRKLFISDEYLFIEKNDENEDKDDLNADADDQNDSNGCQVVIFGTSLQSFSFSGELINEYCLYNSSSIVDASIKVYKRDEEDCYLDAHRVFKILSGLKNVEKLTLFVDTVEVLNYAEELFAHLPVFSNLTNLTLESMLPIEFSCGALLMILRNAPCLDYLDLGMGACLPTYFGNCDSILDPMPSCFVTHLKTIETFGFRGHEDEIQAVKILLNIASVLMSFRINFDSFAFESSEGLKKREEICEQILSFPRGSISCEIVFWCL